MPYVGRDLQRGNYLKLDDIGSSFNGSTTTFNLTSGGNEEIRGIIRNMGRKTDLVNLQIFSFIMRKA